MFNDTLTRSGTARASALDALSPADLGALVLRLVIGLTMAAHGSQKLFGWFHGYGISGTGTFFAMQGYPAAKAMAAVAGLSETLGGLGMAIGLLTPLAAAAVLGTMINALVFKWGGGFFAPAGIEYELVLAVAAGAIALSGPGGLALDRFVPPLRRYRPAYGIGAVVLAVVVAVLVLLSRH
jgi:putative oxidoreductase